MSGRCGFTVIDKDGEEQPCDRPATGWRWYQDHDHEDTLDVACDRHENEGGRRLAAADRENAELRASLRVARDQAACTADELGDEIAGLRAGRDSALADIALYEQQRDDLRAQLAAAQAENAELGRDVASLTEQIAATDARVVELVGQVAEARGQLAEAIDFNRSNQARADRAEMHAHGLRKSRTAAEARLEAVYRIACDFGARLPADAAIAALSATPQPEPEEGSR